MPVHRHVHDKRGSVYALSTELDAWLQGRRESLGEIEKEPEAKAPMVAEADHRRSATLETRRWLALAGVILLALVTVAYFMYRRRAADAAQPKIRSLAVLPMKNLSGNANQEYLADGMTEALIGRLARIHELRVISHTSVMRFSNPQLSVPEIARTLNVDAIVEGSVRRLGRAPLSVDRDALVRDRLAGMSLTEVAEKYGISRASVVRVVRDAKQGQMVEAA